MLEQQIVKNSSIIKQIEMKHIISKLFLICTVLIGVCNTMNAQSNDKKVLHMRIVSHEGVKEEDNDLNNLLKKIINESSLSDDYKFADMRHSGYNDDTEFLSKNSVIGQFSPTQYITTRKALEKMSGNKIRPLFVVGKTGDEPSNSGYYHCYFITSKNSEIINLREDFKDIERFYFVHTKSTSGYTYAIDELLNLNLIKKPCHHQLKNEFGKTVDFLTEHKFVQEAVSKDNHAVGVTWNPDTSLVTKLHRVQKSISQDVIFITSDLDHYRDTIAKWFQNAIKQYPDYFLQSSQHITNLIPYENSRDVYYEEMHKIHEKVKKYDQKYSGDIMNAWWVVKHKDGFMINIIAGLIVLIIGTLCGVIFSFFKRKKLS